MTDTMTMMDTEEVTEDMSALQVSLPAAEEPNGMETNEASDAVANIEQGAAGQGEQVVNEEPVRLNSLIYLQFNSLWPGTVKPVLSDH